jgi:NADPH:quinone reductase-like Zn-dependent oxidoreductase
MKAVRVHAFGGLDAMVYEDVSKPGPGSGQALISVAAAGVGPWDAWVREGKSVIPQPLPLTLGAELSGVIEAVGPDTAGLRHGDRIFGVTNERFTDAYAEYAIAEAAMIASKPARLTDVEAASAPPGTLAAMRCRSRNWPERGSSRSRGRSTSIFFDRGVRRRSSRPGSRRPPNSPGRPTQ